MTRFPKKLGKIALLTVVLTLAMVSSISSIKASPDDSPPQPPSNLSFSEEYGEGFVLSWKPATTGDNLEYELVIDEDAYFSSPEFHKIISENQYFFQYERNLTGDVVYYWKVRTIEEDLASDWSQLDWFKAPAKSSEFLTTPKLVLFATISVIAVTLILWQRRRVKREYFPVEKSEEREKARRKKGFSLKPELDYLAWRGLAAGGEVLGGVTLILITMPVPSLVWKGTFGGIGALLLALGLLDVYRWMDLKRAVERAEEKFKKEQRDDSKERP